MPKKYLNIRFVIMVCFYTFEVHLIDTDIKINSVSFSLKNIIQICYLF